MGTPDGAVAQPQGTLGVALAERRNRAGLSQTGPADRIAYHRTTVTHAELGSHVPAAPFWQACDKLLGAGGTRRRAGWAGRRSPQGASSTPSSAGLPSSAR